MKPTVRAGRRISVAFGIVLIFGGFAYLVWGGIGDNLVYFLTPTELAERGEGGVDVPIRLGGAVAPGSVRWNAEALDLRFTLSDEARSYEVRSRGAPPQMFREGIEVIVEGRLGSDGVFESNNLMVKHSNEYRPPAEGHRPQDLYGDLVPGVGT